jgi:diguanylate cyclase (GGDEF)-like protein/PAS domain S-box-containing protein
MPDDPGPSDAERAAREGGPGARRAATKNRPALATASPAGPPDSKPHGLDLQAGLAATLHDASGPVLGALSVLFAVFVIYNYLDLPPDVAAPVIAHDLVLVVVFALGWRTLSRGHRMRPKWAHPTAVAVLGLILSNILLTAWLLKDTFYTNYVLIVVVGIGALMLSSRWVLASLILTFCAWGATVWSFTAPAQFVHLAFTVVGASALSLALHFTRKRTHIRLLELRHVDEQRKLALERALEETEHARDELDRRVEERTLALSTANARLIEEIEQRTRAQEGLRLADQVFASSGSAIVVTDTSDRVVKVNQAFVDITGFTSEEVLQTDPRSTVIASEHHGADLSARMRESLRSSGRWEGEITIRRRSGEPFPAWLSVNTVRDGEGRVSHHVSMFSDITARKAAEARIEFMAHHDALTGLPNRVRLHDRFLRAVAQARHSDGARVALLFLDLDRFKTINDSLGHSAGDDLLRGFGERLSHCVRSQDTVFRQGGDEFLILLEGIGERRDVEDVARRILEAAAEPFAWGGRALPTSCSIGIALYPDHGEDFDTLLKRADIAMYQSKAAGRNGFSFYGSELLTINILDNFDLEHRLRGALDRGELSLCYQPIVELATRRVVGAEALARWTSAEGASIPPSRFIPIAEESGLIVPIGQWVLEEACREAARWQRDGENPVKLAVNISGVQFMRTDLARVVEGALARSGLPASALELEITESMLVAHVDRCLETIRQLRAMGVSLAVDDFGTGFSNLGYLRRFHVDTLKVDQSFVRDVLRDAEGASIVRAIIDLGRNLSLHTLAEGVERQEQADHLLAAGCQLAQGFLFSPPLPADEFESFLAGPRGRPRPSSKAPGRVTA